MLSVGEQVLAPGAGKRWRAVVWASASGAGMEPTPGKRTV